MNLFHQTQSTSRLRSRYGERVLTAPFAVGAKLAITRWHELLGALDALRGDLGTTCVLLGYTRSERIMDNPRKPGAAVPLLIERFVPAFESWASSLQSWCDQVLPAHWGGERAASNANNDVMTAQPEPPESRCLYMTPARSHIAKNPLKLPPRIPMDAPTLASRLAVPKHPRCS